MLTDPIAAGKRHEQIAVETARFRLCVELPEPAGGVSVSDDGRSQEVLSFNIEQVLAWNPDVILVPQLKDVEKVFGNPLLKDVRAVATWRVFPLPVVAHRWGNRTAEQPLTVLWVARTINPEVFGEDRPKRPK
ncbi:hypothetical protein [Mesorhizobium sp. M0778]|uniref:hypothetical protein n=1 Tax=Mesorhizobium sp. M0778 TaxID=2956999 RepID=UPI00333AFF54